VIVLDDTVDMSWLINKTMHFFKHESCGKCTPCREGAYWMTSLTERITNGDAEPVDVQILRDVALNIRGKSLCALGEFSTEAVVSAIERFPEDFKVEP
jgi:NADH-quinone oxidoreductase subunit F